MGAGRPIKRLLKQSRREAVVPWLINVISWCVLEG